MTTSLVNILHSLPLIEKTPDSWTSLVLENLNLFLIDHASCERKAHAAALMIVTRFPECSELQDHMIGLAREELDHFHQVFRIMRSKNLKLAPDEIDQYVKRLLSNARHPRHEHLLDRLLISALIEARSCERFCLLAIALPDGELKNFYHNFALEEHRHSPLFMDCARLYYSDETLHSRFSELQQIESHIMMETPIRPGVH